MKILFAVNNDNVSEAIVKKYQKEYKEILSYKNVYYFNAIYRELQKDKSYSRVVISEDLEPFANNNYASIDKFLFEKYSKICEEIKNSTNGSIDIILICADRRKKTDDMIIKMYKNEIYNAIIGQDRSIDEVCRLINQPRDKEAAKIYYNIHESELGDSDSENSVSEAEVENIRAHYARLGKNEDKYVESFNNIVAQYTDTQLKIIIKYLPMNVKAVLEERSPKYQQLVTTSALTDFDSRRKTESYKEKLKKIDEKENDEDNFVEQLIKPKNIRNVVIPENITTRNVQKVVVPNVKTPNIEPNNIIIDDRLQEENKPINIPEETIELPDESNEEKEEETTIEQEEQIEQPKRGRGRPRKNTQPEVEKPKRGRGRPKKQVEVEKETNIQPEPENDEQEEIDLFNMEDDTPKQEESKPEEVDLFNMDDTPKQENNNEIDLFDLEDSKDDNEEVDLFNINEEEDKTPKPSSEIDLSYSKNEEKSRNEDVNLYNNNNYMTKTNNTNSNFNHVITADKKIVAFVGTTKNGTSFVVNNTAELLASMGIETAILDMTKSKNAYYIYTDDKESLRETARNCMQNLQNGIAKGIEAKRNLTIYTEMPGEEATYNIEKILTTLVQRYSAILIDTDFDTNPEIFARVQEIYLVQTMDVLTIQPLTAFLRNLKSKEVLKPEKLKIVINKSEKVRSLSVKTLIGGMSCYNSPSMTYMTELFNKDNITFCEIPFEVQNYVKYLDSLVNCSISLNGYTKQFMMALRNLASLVYPLVGKQTYDSKTPMGVDPFSNQINSTLSKMKEKY